MRILGAGQKWQRTLVLENFREELIDVRFGLKNNWSCVLEVPIRPRQKRYFYLLGSYNRKEFTSRALIGISYLCEF